MEVVVAGLLGALLAGAGAYIAQGRTTLSRSDAIALIRSSAISQKDASEVCATHCPYIADKHAIQVTLDAAARAQSELVLEVRALRNDMQAFAVDLATIKARVGGHG